MIDGQTYLDAYRIRSLAAKMKLVGQRVRRDAIALRMKGREADADWMEQIVARTEPVIEDLLAAADEIEREERQ